MGSRCLLFGAKGKSDSPFAYSALLKVGETWPITEDVIRLERHDAKMVRWLYNFRTENRISAEEIKNSLQLNNKGYCLVNKRLLQFGQPDGM